MEFTSQFNAAFMHSWEVRTLMGVEDARPARCWVASASILSSTIITAEEEID